jgi:hypothetical protein
VEDPNGKTHYVLNYHKNKLNVSLQVNY